MADFVRVGRLVINLDQVCAVANLNGPGQTVLAGHKAAVDAAVAMARDRGDTVTVLPPREVVRWRKATEPVLAAWVKQLKEQRSDGDKLLANIRELLGKYANEPEPQPPQRPSPQPAPEQKVVAQPQPRPEAKVEPPKPVPPTPAAAPVAKPAPAAASRPKELDIPL